MYGFCITLYIYYNSITSSRYIYILIYTFNIILNLSIIIIYIYIIVKGPGLALQGPVGSVSRATSGLNAETNQVIFAYFIMSISFAFSTMASFWLVMDAIGAILCSSLFCFSCYFWVKYCVRIYNRFIIIY